MKSGGITYLDCWAKLRIERTDSDHVRFDVSLLDQDERAWDGLNEDVLTMEHMAEFPEKIEAMKPGRK